MVAKKRLFVLVAALLVGGIALYLLINTLPLSLPPGQQKPGETPQKVYDHYVILEAGTDRMLMYVPLVVSVGDELITEENKRYQIVRIEENRAYARFVEYVGIPKDGQEDQKKK
ncbi:stage II sporulation protein P [Anaeroselena agilis]|uniref:Stage II sporulation protein P n=1 Tax=Anaeroselena agilis TaxID=3063788 RepID=A0ABU3P130_9FIRM|nr:stage II sporulation protein P [Selenomonadales bacterium 4137-cl]